VPAPRKKARTGADTPRPEKKATARPVKAKAEKQPAKKSAGKKGATKATQPTLVHLIHLHLAEQSEPRSAAEVAETLSAAHPDRAIATTVVRTSLETLVAKSLAHRTKQGRSVFYTATHTPEPTSAPVDDAQSETAE
jgi:Fe2+ or Zn2+ uptake regulation protein